MNNVSNSPVVLVTGSAGLLGNELIAQLLMQGKTVRAIYNHTTLNLSHASLQMVRCDISDVTGLEEVMKGIDYVYHCAAKVSFERGHQDDLFKINIEGTANVVNAALNAKIKKLVHVSSVAALGRLREYESINETMQWTPETSNSIYGQSKYFGELEVWRGIAEGLNAVIINPSIILGAGNWNDGSTGIFKSAYDEFPWFTEGSSGFVDVRDVAKIMILLMHSDVSGERFIISAQNSTYHDVFNHIALAFNKRLPHKKVTPLVASIVWRWEALKSMFKNTTQLVTKETAATALAKVEFDNRKLFQYFPDFQYQTLEHTISHTCGLLQQKVNIR